MAQVRSFWSPARCFAVTYAAYTAIYVARVNLSMVSPALKDAGVLTAAQIGLLGGVFSVTYAAGRLLNGILNDRLAPWTMIAAGLGAVGFGNVLSGLFPPFALMVALWGINAYGQSMLWGSVLHVVSALYDPAKARLRSAAAATAVATGNLVGIVANAWLVSRFGPRFAYIVPGLLNLVMAPLVFAALGRLPASAPAHRRTVADSFRIVAFRRMRAMLFPALCHGIVKDNVSLWMAVYFVDAFRVDLMKSSYFLLLVPAVGLAGRLSYEFFYRRCGSNESAVASRAFAVSAVMAALLLLPGVPPWAAAIGLGLIYAAVSVASSSLLAVFPLRFARLGESASASGFLDFATYFGAGVGSIVYGVVVRRFGLAGYGVMFASWAVLSVASSAILAAIARRQRAAS